jgi:hypothetical protein
MTDEDELPMDGVPRAGPLEEVREQLRGLRALRAALEESAAEAECTLLGELGEVRVEQESSETTQLPPWQQQQHQQQRLLQCAQWTGLFECWEHEEEEGAAEQLRARGREASERAAQRRDALLRQTAAQHQRTLQRVQVAQRTYHAHISGQASGTSPAATIHRRAAPYQPSVHEALQHSVLGQLARRAAESRHALELAGAHESWSDQVEFSVNLEAGEVVRAARLLQLCEFMERREAGEVHPALLPFRLHEDELDDEPESTLSDSGDEDALASASSTSLTAGGRGGHNDKRRGKDKHTEPASLRLQMNPLHQSNPANRSSAADESSRKASTPRSARRRLRRFFGIGR